MAVQECSLSLGKTPSMAQSTKYPLETHICTLRCKRDCPSCAVQGLAMSCLVARLALQAFVALGLRTEISSSWANDREKETGACGPGEQCVRCPIRDLARVHLRCLDSRSGHGNSLQPPRPRGNHGAYSRIIIPSCCFVSRAGESKGSTTPATQDALPFCLVVLPRPHVVTKSAGSAGRLAAG